MHIVKSIIIGSSLMCLHLLTFATALNDKYTPKDIFISYSQDNLIINQGASEIKLPKVKIEAKEKGWPMIPFTFSTHEVSRQGMKQLLELSNKFGFKLDYNDLKLFEEINHWIGTKYKYASQSTKGIDCSGFTNMLYQRVYNRSIDRSSRSQASQLKKIVEKEKLQPGNLVFFATNRRNKQRITHVGIYLGSGYFAHASTQKGVTISELSENYYASRYIMGGEI